MMVPARKQPDLTCFSGRFSDRLYTLRMKAKMTGEEMAEKIGVPKNTYYNWERGSREMPQDYYPVVADVLGLKSVRMLLPKE